MKLHKSYTDKVFLGVCGGIGESLGVNPVIIRVVWALLIFFSRSIFLWLYFILGFVLPYGHGGDEGGSSGRPGVRKYSPEDPPFDISGAQDVEIDREDE